MAKWIPPYFFQLIFYHYLVKKIIQNLCLINYLIKFVTIILSPNAKTIKTKFNRQIKL